MPIFLRVFRLNGYPLCQKKSTPQSRADKELWTEFAIVMIGFVPVVITIWEIFRF